MYSRRECIKEKKKEKMMQEEFKMKSLLFRTFCAILVGLMLFVMKFILKEEKFVEEVYNYLASDIVFLK